MIAASADVPAAVPIILLALGIFIAIGNRQAFTDFDVALHRMAEKRARSRRASTS